MGVRSPRCYELMKPQTIDLVGFEFEIVSELYCERGGDHREPPPCSHRLQQLGQSLDESPVLCA